MLLQSIEFQCVFYSLSHKMPLARGRKRSDRAGTGISRERRNKKRFPITLTAVYGCEHFKLRM